MGAAAAWRQKYSAYQKVGGHWGSCSNVNSPLVLPTCRNVDHLSSSFITDWKNKLIWRLPSQCSETNTWCRNDSVHLYLQSMLQLPSLIIFFFPIYHLSFTRWANLVNDDEWWWTWPIYMRYPYRPWPSCLTLTNEVTLNISEKMHLQWMASQLLIIAYVRFLFPFMPVGSSTSNVPHWASKRLNCVLYTVIVCPGLTVSTRGLCITSLWRRC